MGNKRSKRLFNFKRLQDPNKRKPRLLFYQVPVVDTYSGKMARGLSRDQSREKNQKKAVAAGGGGKDDGMTPAQRNERDAKMMAEKKAKKEAMKANGDISSADEAAEEARKAKLKEGAKARQDQKAMQSIKKK